MSRTAPSGTRTEGRGWTAHAKFACRHLRPADSRKCYILAQKVWRFRGGHIRIATPASIRAPQYELYGRDLGACGYGRLLGRVDSPAWRLIAGALGKDAI